MQFFLFGITTDAACDTIFGTIIHTNCSLIGLQKDIQSFVYIWLHKGNQNEFLEHPKIKWLYGGHEPPTSGLPVHCSTT